jgi:hypothetical protein
MTIADQRVSDRRERNEEKSVAILIKLFIGMVLTNLSNHSGLARL